MPDLKDAKPSDFATRSATSGSIPYFLAVSRIYADRPRGSLRSGFGRLYCERTIPSSRRRVRVVGVEPAERDIRVFLRAACRAELTIADLGLQARQLLPQLADLGSVATTTTAAATSATA